MLPHLTNLPFKHRLPACVFSALINKALLTLKGWVRGHAIIANGYTVVPKGCTSHHHLKHRGGVIDSSGSLCPRYTKNKNSRYDCSEITISSQRLLGGFSVHLIQ